MSALNASTSASRPGSFPVRPRRALVGAALLTGVLAACWCAAFHSAVLARADAHAYFAFLGLSEQHHALAAGARWIANLCQPMPFVYLAAAPIIVALLRRRWALAIAIAVMIPAAVLASETLKPLLEASRPAAGVASTPIGTAGSWPSGHSTAAMSLAMAYMLASPARWRPYVAVLGSLFALAVIYAVLTLGWHYPSDALGGILVASIFTLLAVAGVVHVDARYGRDLSRLSGDRGTWLQHMPSIPAMLAAVLIPAGVVLLTHGGQAVTYAVDHKAFVFAVLSIAALGGLAPTALTMALSGNGAGLSGSGRAARAALPPRWRRG